MSLAKEERLEQVMVEGDTTNIINFIVNPACKAGWEWKTIMKDISALVLPHLGMGLDNNVANSLIMGAGVKSL